MKLTLWTYEGPPHIGAMRVATSMIDVHYVLHAPQGDTYADLLFTMIERRDKRPPVTYTTFQARDLGGDTADLVIQTIKDAANRYRPNLMLVGESCTAELIQDQPGALAEGLGLDMPVVPLELPAYSKKENFGASETFYHIVRRVLGARPQPREASAQRLSSDRRPLANLLGPSSLGFRCRDDVTEITRLLAGVGVDVNVVAPWEASVADISQIPDADFNICLYPEVAETTCRWLEKNLHQPYVKTVPIGVGATREFLQEIAELASVDVTQIDQAVLRLPWYSKSIDSTYLTAKRVFVFGDATHALAAARVATEELGFELVGIGTYSREFARDVRAAAERYEVEALISDDYLEVEARIVELQPEIVLGTQMERHIAKRLGIACAVISSPVHVEDFPARYSPQMGVEGANVIFDTWVHPLMMGLEEHLLGMFREDFEFHDGAAASHLGTHASTVATDSRSVSDPEAHIRDTDVEPTEPTATNVEAAADSDVVWSVEAESELRKIPFFVRGKARRNTTRYAQEMGLTNVTLDTLYDAKAHFGR